MPIFNKWLRQERRTAADPYVWARNPAGNALMRHYGAGPEGVNVYVIRNTPTDQLYVDTYGDPYAVDLYPYSDTYSDTYGQPIFTVTEDDPLDLATCELICYGGHDTEIDDTMATVLTSAGYGEWITGSSGGGSDTFSDTFTEPF